MTGWTTREAAEKCGLTQYTLRWYERIGLLDRVERTADGRRRFSDSDLDWLMLLSKLRATRMPVRDMLRYAELVRSGAQEQERLALLYNEQGQRPEEIARKLGLSTYNVTQIILGSRNRGKL